MDALRLIELIRSPDSVNQEDTEKLKDLIDRHPFFNIGHLLYLNGLRRFDLPAFEEALNRSAVRIADRRVLYQLIKQAQAEGSKVSAFRSVDMQSTVPVETERQEDVETVRLEDKETERQEDSKTERLVDVETVRQEDVKTQRPEEIVEIKTPTELPSSAEALAKADKPSQPIKPSLDDIFAGIHEDIDEEEEIVETIRQDDKETERLEDGETARLEVQAIEELEVISETENTVVETETSPENSKPSQHSNPSKPVNEEPESLPTPTTPPETATPLPSKKMNLGTFNSWLKQHIQEKNEQSANQPAALDKTALIDKFIEAEPKISKPKAEFFNPIESSKRSVQDNESIVSETLARIYAEQGDYEKAISAYKKLSLEKPEKSTYFAALIYELELKQSLE